MIVEQKIPSYGPAREKLRQKGQFWTPDWVAEAMVGYITAGGAKSIFDPAVGAGAFFKAAKTIGYRENRHIELLGTELDPLALEQAYVNNLDENDLRRVEITNFVLHPPARTFEAIAANPPYIRHHRLLLEDKIQLKQFAKDLTGLNIDGRAGLHVYFLLRALQLLRSEGRLAFILPADICEGVFANTLWKWITAHYKLDAVITFDPKATPFPGIDTNPLIFLILNCKPTSQFCWVKCKAEQTSSLAGWMSKSCNLEFATGLNIQPRNLEEGLITGFSRQPGTIEEAGPTLADFARVMRGIATGANEFFFLTQEQAANLAIPSEFLLTAIGRTRDVTREEITEATLAQLEAKGRPTRLLALDGRQLESFPEAVQSYLKVGQENGINQRELIKQRRPWYKMEVRKPPPILFAYLGRRNIRFIHNKARVLPLTGFLCLYPYDNSAEHIHKLMRVLQHPQTLENLALVGKSYGDGAIKVEPRALERLLLPQEALLEAGLQLPKLGKGLSQPLDQYFQQSFLLPDNGVLTNSA